MTARERIKVLQRYVGATPDGIIGRETLSSFSTKFSKNRVQTIHFFANIHHESAGFSIIRENMSYSAPRIREIFGIGKHSARVSLSESISLAHKPYALAERVYGLGNPLKAKELGNLRTGDGWKYRGGGAIQITGGDAYKRFGDERLYREPDLIASSAYYFTTAVRYFDRRNIWALATDLSAGSIERVCRAINGGLNGIADRRNKIAFYDSLWVDRIPPVPVPSQIKTTTANLNLRASGSISSSIKRVLLKGTKVAVLKVSGAWSEVSYGSETGWVSNQYLA